MTRTEFLDALKKWRMFKMPIYPLSETYPQPFAYEALLRGPNGESPRATRPGEFDLLDEAARADARLELDLFCAEKAIIDASDHLEPGVDLSVNVHLETIVGSDEYLDRLLAFSDKYGFPCNRLILEILEQETRLKVNWPTFAERKRSLFNQVNLRFAIDDQGQFGTSDKMILDIEPNFIKMAAVLMLEYLDRKPELVLVIIDKYNILVNSYGGHLIVEGVRDATVVERLRKMEEHEPRLIPPRYIQGFVFGEPLPFKQKVRHSVPIGTAQGKRHTPQPRTIG